MIKKIHQIWIGNEPSSKVISYMKSVKDMNPDYEYVLWGNDKLEELGVKQYFDEDYVPSFISNIMRMKILQKHGGWYIDADVIAHGSLNNLEPGTYANAISEVKTTNKIHLPGIIYSDTSVNFDLLIYEYPITKPFGSYYNWFLNMKKLYTKITRLPTHLVGKNGTILQDIRMNSWTNHPNNSKSFSESKQIRIP